MCKAWTTEGLTSPGIVAGLQQGWDGGDVVGQYTHSWSMVLHEYRLIRKDRQGRRGEAVMLCAKSLLHGMKMDVSL